MKTLSCCLAACLVLGFAAQVARATTAPAPVRLAAEDDEEDDRLIPVGKVAPDFVLPVAGGGEVGLTSVLKVSKAVLIVFWSRKAEAKTPVMPKAQKIFDDLQEKGLYTVGINPEDNDSQIQRFNDGKFSFPLLIDGKESNRAVTGVYKARVLPTVYLLDNQAKVLWRARAFDDAALRAEMAKVGVK